MATAIVGLATAAALAAQAPTVGLPDESAGLDQIVRTLISSFDRADIRRSRKTAAVSVLTEQVLEKHGKALVIYGAAHFYRTVPPDYLASMGADVGLIRTLDTQFPGRTFAVIRVGGLPARIPGLAIPDPDYVKFDRALQTAVRPVLVSLQRPPFRDLFADEFLGPGLLSCRPPGGCRSAFKGSPITLGQIADAVVYFGNR